MSIVGALSGQLRSLEPMLEAIRAGRQKGVIVLRFDERGRLGQPRVTAEGEPRALREDT